MHRLSYTDTFWDCHSAVVALVLVLTKLRSSIHCISFNRCCFASQNFPLYIRTVNPQNETDLQFQYLVHISIDVIEEKSTYMYMFRYFQYLTLVACSGCTLVTVNVVHCMLFMHGTH